MLHEAQNRHFEFMGRFLTQYYGTMGPRGTFDDVEAVGELMRQCVGDLAEQLHCPDVRIYLAEELPDAYEIENLEREPVAEGDRRLLMKWASGDGVPDAPVRWDDPGPIGWAVRRGALIYIHNRDVAEEFPSQMRALYPELESLDSVGVDKSGNKIDVLRPIASARGPAGFVGSLLIHPIVVGGRSIGALVCNGRRRSPYVFHEWDSTSLGLIALAIGGTWLSLTNRQRAALDGALVARAVVEINRYGSRIGEWMASGADVSDDEIYQTALDAADRIMGIRAFSSIRLFDPVKREFQFKYYGGSVWEERDLKRRAAGLRFRVDGEPATTAATHVYRTRLPLLVDVLRRPQHFQDLFRGITQIGLYIPIPSGTETNDLIGLLDIRSVEHVPFPPSASGILDILAQMLSLAVALIDGQRKLLFTNRLMQGERDKQTLILEDMAHQVTTPQRNANQQLATVARVLGSTRYRDLPSFVEVRNALMVARGLLRRAIRVGLTAKLFQELRVTGRISQQPDALPIKKIRLEKMILEIIEDQKLLLRPNQKLQFWWESHSVNFHYKDDIVGDVSHIEQVLTNLIENAAKYSLKVDPIGWTGIGVT